VARHAVQTIRRRRFYKPTDRLRPPCDVVEQTAAALNEVYLLAVQVSSSEYPVLELEAELESLAFSEA